MYAATLEPLLDQCNQAIEFAKKGAIEEARVCMDRIRYLRSVLAHQKIDSDARSVEQVDQFGQRPELLSSYMAVAKSVNDRLSLIHQWITESRASFSVDDLRQSCAGVNLFLDDALPGIWDFSQDVAVITDLDGQELREVLRTRGHKKFVWLTQSQALLTDVLEDGVATDTLYVRAGTYPEKAELEQFLARLSVPRAALLTTMSTDKDEEHFFKVANAIGAAVIAGTTTQWLPQMTSEQWLSLTPRLAQLPSVMSLKSTFEDADVLVVSPGPSLHRDLELLSKVQNRFLILASVKALAALFDAGIKPDLAIWQDPKDHSEAIPIRAETSEVGLILNESCHPAFYESGFATFFPYADPGFLGTDLSQSLHGEAVPQFSGTCVSSLSVVMALAFNAKSVTLVGQDLSVAEGLYVQGGICTEKQAPIHEGYLTCRGIDGESLPTLPNYYSFIDEFVNIARCYAESVSLINATAKGAYLEGWHHVRLSEHPILQEPEPAVREKKNIAEQFIGTGEKKQSVLVALAKLSASLDHASKICNEIQKECLEKVQTGSNDCTVIDLLEQRLKQLFDEECPLLQYSTSRQSMALTVAMESVQNLEQNLRISADYYQSVSLVARQLLAICQNAVREIKADQRSLGV